MKRLIFFMVVSMIFINAAHTYAQSSDRVFDIDLWQNGLPNTNGKDHLPFDDNTQNYKPSIRVFLPAEEVATGRAVIACPGGSYAGLAYGHEGYEWAPFFNKHGIAYITLKYRKPRGNREVPFSDAEEALRLVKQMAEEWNIDPDNIGIMGSSAGGHLASTIATHSKPGSIPAFQILFYPVISMCDSLTHAQSRTNLLGKDYTNQLVEMYSNDKQVKSNTPRAFIVFSDDDDGVTPLNGIYYYNALKVNNVPASLHIYPSGGHGWGSKKDFKYNKELEADLSAWLHSF